MTSKAATTAPVNVILRAATQRDLDQTGIAGRANLMDGSMAVLVDAKLVGLTDEYGSAVWRDGASAATIEAIIDAKERLLAETIGRPR